MAAVESFLNEDANAKKRRRKMLFSILIGVVLLHVAAGVVAGIFVVARYIFPPPANFVVKKDVRLPAKKREQKMNMAAVDAIAPKPTLSDKMQSSRPTSFSLPDVPDMPLDQMLPLDPSQLLTDQLASLSNAEALGTASGAGAAGSGGFGGKGISFLGVQSNGKRILLLTDVSQTIPKLMAAAGIPFEKFVDEVQTVFKNLPITARFGIASFKTHHEYFRKELVPINNTNRNAATTWIEDKVRRGNVQPSPGSNGKMILAVLEYAKDVKPDLVFIVTDGSYHPDIVQWPEVKKGIEEIKDESGKPSQINIILFGPTDNDVKEMRKIASADNVTVTVKK